VERTEPTARMLAERLDWIERVDAVLARAEAVTGAARADDAPLSDRIALWVEIIAVRQRLHDERARMLVEVTRWSNC
jgi:hypothetical protein